MSCARKCDRCGEVFNPCKGVRFEYYNLNDEYGELDLCPDCHLEFKEFMKGTKPKNLLERLLRKIKEI